MIISSSVSSIFGIFARCFHHVCSQLHYQFLSLSRVFCCNTALPCRPLPTQHTHTTQRQTDTDRHRQHITYGTCLVLILVVMASVSGQAIVVGGGLARMSAANTILENGGRVVLLGESFFCFGNSTHPKGGELCLCRAKSGKTLAKARFE